MTGEIKIPINPLPSRFWTWKISLPSLLSTQPFYSPIQSSVCNLESCILTIFNFFVPSYHITSLYFFISSIFCAVASLAYCFGITSALSTVFSSPSFTVRLGSRWHLSLNWINGAVILSMFVPTTQLDINPTLQLDPQSYIYPILDNILHIDESNTNLMV